MADVREPKQLEAKNAFLSSQRKNSIIASVGSGKSKIAIDLIDEVVPRTILLLTNATDLRDFSWKYEFEKFNKPNYWTITNSKTYQGMYDKEWDDYDMVILDEVDFACTAEYGKCLIQANKHGKVVLCLTGFITEDKRDILNSYFPICYEIPTEEMQRDGLLNKSEFIFVEYPLSTEKNIEQKMKKGGFFRTSENDQYVFWDKKYQQALIMKSAVEKKYRMQFEPFSDKADWKAADFNFKFTASKRKNILHGLQSSVKVTFELMRYIHSTPGNKVLIFSANTKQCDHFPFPFHSKRVVATLYDLNTGRVNSLAVVKKITRGVNLVGVNYLIRESFDGSEETFQQSHGRLLRLRPDQVARYIVLVPYYTALVREADGVFRKNLLATQAANWATKMMQSFKTEEIRYIKLDSSYKLRDGIIL